MLNYVCVWIWCAHKTKKNDILLLCSESHVGLEFDKFFFCPLNFIAFHLFIHAFFFIHHKIPTKKMDWNDHLTSSRSKKEEWMEAKLNEFTFENVIALTICIKQCFHVTQSTSVFSFSFFVVELLPHSFGVKYFKACCYSHEPKMTQRKKNKF